MQEPVNYGRRRAVRCRELHRQAVVVAVGLLGGGRVVLQQQLDQRKLASVAACAVQRQGAIRVPLPTRRGVGVDERPHYTQRYALLMELVV
jgi:hypothetical protein